MARKKYVQGADTVARVLGREIPRENIKRITDALNRGAMEIAARAELLVPVDQGDLKESIEARTTGIRAIRKGKSVATFVVAGTDGETAISAFRQEFGRAPGPLSHPGHAANPFMFPAYWSLRKRVVGRVRREINKAAKVVAGRHRGTNR